MHIKTKIPLQENVIDVWYCSFDANRKKIADYFELLSEDEKQRAGRFKFQKDQDCFVISRGILRMLLGHYLSKDPTKIQFKYTAYKKPLLVSEDSLKFNISHSADKAAFAFFQNQELGIDIEKVKEDFDVLRLAQSFFSQTEIAFLEKLPKNELHRAFFRCWTRKEALIKAEGSGLSFPLDKFAVSLDSDDSAELISVNHGEIQKENWILFSNPIQKKYVSAVAVANPHAQIRYLNWDSLK